MAAATNFAKGVPVIMTRIYPAFAFCLLIRLAWPSAAPAAESKEEQTVQLSKAVLSEIVSVPLKGIPRSMLADAQGIAIIPNLIKGSFVVGARHGRGVLVVRQEDGTWQLPVFISLTGGNIGWQIGLQSTDLILVFKTRQSIQGIRSGKLTIGADAAAAAGPVGRQAAAATDGHLKAEILSWSRSRGLFAGVSIDGSVLQVDPNANAFYYGTANPAESQAVPESAVKLLDQIAAHCGPQQVDPAAPPPGWPQPGGTEVNAVRAQLAEAAPRLYRILDEQWATFLALPGEIFNGQAPPSSELLNRSLTHFDTVAIDPHYRDLAQRPEFQTTHNLLRQYAAALTQPAAQLTLPPPPVETGAAPSGPSRF
jgi:lipid-binding SYLF domain-containing protein